MEKISRAQLNSALTTTGRPSAPQLSAEDLTQLSLVVDQMQLRYPAQDTAEPIEGMLWDLERLALRYSTRKVIDALAELRIKPGQKFFPRPDEVAEEIVRQREAHRHDRERRESEERRRREEEDRKRLMSPEEVSWRVEKFGYDPFTEKRA